ncbi:MAG: GNA1162 family protein [bacterium]
MSESRLSLAGLALLAGCAVTPAYHGPPPRVAILPFDNRTNDVSAPDYVRGIMWERLKQFGWIVPPLADVDAALRPLGVTQGGQLRTVTPEQLTAATGADLVLYATIEQFTHITAGVAEKRAVKISARLVDAAGRHRWAKTRTAGKSDVTLGAASSLGAFGRSLGVQLRDKLVEGAFAHKLAAETRSCVNALVSSLPRRGLP